jgi:hypothetical protein
VEIAINVALLLLGFLGAVAAFGGETWHKGEEPVLKRITKRGWISISALSLTLALGIAKEFRARTAAEASAQAQSKLENQLRITNNQLITASASRDNLAVQFQDANQTISLSNSALDKANAKLEKAQRAMAELRPDILEAMFRLTERIPREDDFAFVQFAGNSIEIPKSSQTSGPLQLYGGDIFEYHLFCNERSRPVRLWLDTQFRRYEISGNDRDIRVSGPIGQPMPARIINPERRRDCGMKIIVRSTDRTRTRTQFKELLDSIKSAKRLLAQ